MQTHQILTMRLARAALCSLSFCAAGAAQATSAAEVAEHRLASGAYTSREHVVIRTRSTGCEPLAVAQSELTTRRDDGGALFNRASGRCVVVGDDDGRASPAWRSCIFVDPSGDRFTTQSRIDAAGRAEAYGVRRARLGEGTGKYAGLSGEMTTYPVLIDPATPQRDGRSIGRIEIRYRIDTTGAADSLAASRPQTIEVTQ